MNSFLTHCSKPWTSSARILSVARPVAFAPIAARSKSPDPRPANFENNINEAAVLNGGAARIAPPFLGVWRVGVLYTYVLAMKMSEIASFRVGKLQVTSDGDEMVIVTVNDTENRTMLD